MLGKWSARGKRAAQRLRLPDDFPRPLLGAFLKLGNADKHSVIVDRHRARFILSRKPLALRARMFSRTQASGIA